MEEPKVNSMQVYNKLKSEYTAQVKKLTELEEERREHNLVLNSIREMKDSRRMWKLMGGILVEKSKEDITRILQETLQLIGQAQTGLSQSIKEAEKKLMDYELKVGIRPPVTA